MGSGNITWSSVDGKRDVRGGSPAGRRIRHDHGCRPMVAIWAAGIYATSCDGLINAVAIKPPFNSTKASGPNPEPLTFISNHLRRGCAGGRERRNGRGRVTGAGNNKTERWRCNHLIGRADCDTGVPAVAMSSRVIVAVATVVFIGAIVVVRALPSQVTTSLVASPFRSP